MNDFEPRPRILWVPHWANVWESDSTLTPGLCQDYRRTIGAFLAFCRQRQAAVAVSVPVNTWN